jgi:hypothetical protein
MGKVARFFLVQLTKTRKNVPNHHKIYHGAVNMPIGKNRPNGHKIDQHFPLQDPPKFTQSGIIFGLKTNHLATQLVGREIGSGQGRYWVEDL